MSRLAKQTFVRLLTVFAKSKRRLQRYKLMRKHNLTISSSIKNVILQSYGRKKYNTHFLINEIIQLCRTIAPEVTITSDNIFITASLRMSPSSTPEFKRINFKNTLQTLPIGNVEIKFDDTLIPFVIKAFVPCQLLQNIYIFKAFLILRQ